MIMIISNEISRTTNPYTCHSGNSQRMALNYVVLGGDPSKPQK